MTTITLEGKEYQLDIEQAKKLNLLKEKDNKVKSWKEFKEKYINDTGYVYVEELKHSQTTSVPLYIADQLTPHEAKALAAFSKLLKLRRDWIGEWEPNWHNPTILKYCLMENREEVSVVPYQTLGHIFSFPTEQMAEEFLETFHDLIGEVKTLI